MSLVTRCPACATPFKVVKDQLRISDGWVRCGRCSQVFDATLDLHDTSELPPEVAAQSPSPVADEIDALPREADGANESALLAQSPPVELPQMDVEEIRAADVEAEFFDDQQDVEKENAGPAHPSSMAATSPQADDEEDDELSSSAPPAGMAMPDVVWPDADMLSFEDKGRVAIRPPAPAPLSFPDIDLSLPSRPAAPAIAPEIPAADASATDEVGDIQLQKALRRARVKSAKIAKAKAREQKAAAAETAPVVLAASEPEIHPHAPEAVIAAPSLFGEEKADGFWQRPAVRRSMAAIAVLGVVLLVGQMAYQERDLIVARQPSLRPAMESMCRMLGCEVSALRQINDIKVDGASFAREKNDDGYRFSFTLRNAAEVPLAMPAVELSLLDTQERAIVRRVLRPTDFGAPTVLPARSERSASLSLRLTGPEAALMPPVAGFRVETLYP